MSIDKLQKADSMQSEYTIDRKAASKLLKVSIRTVDRYIRSKKLAIEEKDGRIRLNKKQIIKLRRSEDSRQDMDTASPIMSIDKRGSVPVSMSIDSVHSVSTRNGQNSSGKTHITGGEVYQKLFEELQLELKSKQERLEGANYRVGQLEGLLKESMPLMDHNRLLLAERTEKQEIEAQHLSLKIEYDQIGERYRDEHLSRRVLIIFLFIIMLLQPLWLLLSLKH
jgi:hypothetical protein